MEGSRKSLLKRNSGSRNLGLSTANINTAAVNLPSEATAFNYIPSGAPEAEFAKRAQMGEVSTVHYNAPVMSRASRSKSPLAGSAPAHVLPMKPVAKSIGGRKRQMRRSAKRKTRRRK
jgi:hypothetical protein